MRFSIVAAGAILLAGCAAALDLNSTKADNISATSFSCNLGERGGYPQTLHAAILTASGKVYFVYDSHAIPLIKEKKGEVSHFTGMTYRDFDYSNLKVTQGPDPGDIVLDWGTGAKQCRHMYPKATPVFPM